MYSESGLELKSCVNLASNEKYSAVPPDQRFIYIPHVVGREVPLVDIAPLGKPVVLKTLSQKPKVFELINFFDDNEAEFLINNALALRSETHRLKRSTTGSENILVDSKRTSESAFDISSSVALLLKKRTIKMLRYGLYDETVMDGFQILRYNVSAAYNDHYDYIDSSSDPKYDSYRGGTNRFATVLFYLNTVEEGGETMFPNADGPPERVHTIEEGPEGNQEYIFGLEYFTDDHTMLLIS